MNYSNSGSVHRRTVKVYDVDVEVEFTFTAGYDATLDEPGYEDEIIIEAVFVDEIEITNLIGDSTFEKIEQELFKMHDSGEGV